MAYRRPRFWRDYLAQDHRAKVTGKLGPEFEPGGPYHCLPAFYKAHYLERVTREDPPVHWRPAADRWRLVREGVRTTSASSRGAAPATDTRHMEPEARHVPNVPLPVIYPREADAGLWGGEGVVRGYVARAFRKYEWSQPALWWPRLRREALHSELLDRWLLVSCTKRTLDLVDAHRGLDHYVLATPDSALRSELGVRLKRAMLAALATGRIPGARGDLGRVQELSRRYARYRVPLDQVEWLGLTPDQALRKWNAKLEREVRRSVRPLKEVYEERLLRSLTRPEPEGADGVGGAEEPQTVSWLSSINPFAKRASKTGH